MKILKIYSLFLFVALFGLVACDETEEAGEYANWSARNSAFVDSIASVARANERIKRSTEEAFADTVRGYETVIPVNSSISLQNGRARYALYPVWILNTKWGDQNFTFAINGQTGKIAGDLPMDKGLFRNWFLGVTAAVTAAAFAVSYLFWLL